MDPFEIMAEPVRRRIIEVLAVGSHPSGMVADAVAGEFGVSRSAVSHHLKVLRDHGVVKVIPDYTQRLYLLEEGFLLELDEAVGELFALWRHRYGFGTDGDPLRLEPSRVPHAERRLPARLHRAGCKGRRGR
ncbi:helix-turn-helix domain-containing protein [Agromyces endophyticus]|uniref:helix-turn-helix domain-containing protein n=1 Tax=Agromyces sp. H17E-10 TaxID=2932244 RepID=UPI001FD4BB71|nr:helix-turn-helix domain-containing protein [Agromyces sp. H17E-10]UOQ90814.1 helix-turn-helix domain-containing protein [Agromyces sp. H17E-10]